MAEPVPVRQQLVNIIYVNRIGIADPSDLRNCDERIADALLRRFKIEKPEESL